MTTHPKTSRSHILLACLRSKWVKSPVAWVVGGRLPEYSGMCAHHQSSPRSMFTKGRFCTIATSDIWAAVMQCGQHLSGEDERLVEHARLQMGDGPVEGRLTLSGRVDANRHHNRLSLVRPPYSDLPA